MVMLRIGFRSRPACCGIAVTGMFLVVVLALCVPVRCVATGDEASQAPSEGRGWSLMQLPDGMDPVDIVRLVERNQEALEDGRGSGLVGGAEPPVSAPLRLLDEVGTSFQIGLGDPIYGVAPGDQRAPAVAFDGTNYLVVWQDHRNSSYPDIYGCRVDGSGVLLDLTGIAISVAADSQRAPAVAFDGTNYLVVWQDHRNGPPGIYGCRVGVGGEVLDANGIAISAGAYDQTTPAVAFDGANYLVVWQDHRNGPPDIYGCRVGIGGAVLDAGGIPISMALYSQRAPAVASDGTNFLVVWEDYRTGLTLDIYGSRVGAGGNVLDASGIAISPAASEQSHPAVAFDGTNFLVVWEDYRTGLTFDIYGARVGVDGEVLDGAGVAISTAANNQMMPRAAFDGTNYLVVWQDSRNGLPDIYGCRVGVTGSVLDEAGIAISTAENAQGSPAVAFGGTNYLAAWQDFRDGTYPSLFNIYGSRVDVGGGVLDAGGIVLSTSVDSQTDPSVAFDGTNYLVVWLGYCNCSYGIYGCRVGAGGEVLDPAGIAISTAANNKSSPAVAFDGTGYLVVWGDYRNGYPDIYGCRVGVDGEVLDPAGIAICTSEDYLKLYPKITFDGTNYLVVWTDTRSISGDIYGSRVGVGGDVLDVGGIAISTAINTQVSPSVAFDGTNYLVVWSDKRSGVSYDIYGSRVGVGGNVLDAGGIAISTAINDQINPGVAFDGTNYLVMWSDRRGDVSYDVYGCRIGVGGGVLDPGGIVISAEPGDQLGRGLAKGTNCTELIVYSSFAPAPYNSFRIWGNIWKGPTSLTFASATATVSNGCVKLSWEMAIDVPALSLRVERSESPRGGFVELEVPVLKDSRYSFSCTDCQVELGGTYWYKIVLVGISGEEAYGPIGVYVDAVPVAYKAYQSYPNPFNPVCTIRYDVPCGGSVSLRVYDTGGALVRELVEGWCEPGTYSEVWDGRADDGTALPSGVYFYRLDAGDFTATRKAVLLR